MKKILYGTLLSTVALATIMTSTSCEDMLKPESDIVLYPEDNQLDTPYDTVYSTIGIAHLMLKVLDRTNLLGEVRADLSTLTPSASKDLQELAANDVSLTNVYNNPQDYYKIINNCNYFIANADSTLKKNGVKVFERELATVRGWRAWTYLQLVLNYGEIPFYLDFLDNQLAAEEIMKQPKLGIKEVCAELIADIEPCVGVLPTTYLNRRVQFPPKLLLGELNLWAGNYAEAAKWYHDYVTDVDHPLPVEYSFCSREFTSNGGRSQGAGYLSRNFANLYLAYDSDDFYGGTVSDLPNLYNSTIANKNCFEITYSESALQRSESQHCVVVRINEDLSRDTLEWVNDWNERLWNGDLRLKSEIAQDYTSTVEEGFGHNIQEIYSKIDPKVLMLYRSSVVYLHFAEALNRAGFPTAAFAVLKYGLCEDNTTNRASGNPIAADEVERAGDLLYFDPAIFKGMDYTTYVNTRSNSTTIPSSLLEANTVGIHCYGGTAADADTTYNIPALPSAIDTTLWVEDKIIEELALETIFEGQRFYDLMRVALRRDDNSFLANAVASRDGGPANLDAAMQSRMMDRKNWYLPLK